MNVFHRFTRASLRKNRSRTLVTIIGIVLSMALFTAVIQGAYSGVQFLIRGEVARVGAFHGYFYQLSDEEAARVRDLDFVDRSTSWQTVGWAEIGSENEYKPYLLLRGVDADFTDLCTVHLTTGRMPESSGELLLPDHLAANGGVNFRVGDTLKLTVGRRLMDGYDLNEYNPFMPGMERIDGVERVYTVVGFYQRFDNQLENYACPGYTALTARSGQETGEESVFFTVKNPARYYEDMQSQTVSERWDSHSDLLRLYGTVRSGNISTVIYGFAGILIFLIFFGSVSLIYNSFAISVSERTQQFGILKSVGATKKQIRGSVLYEALLLGGAGVLGGAVVGCAGIGITLWALRDAFAAFTMADGVQMKLVVTPAGLLIAAAVCLLTTLVSAWIPARRADRVSAIDAIRQTEDIQVRGKDVKVSGLTKKLFGFEGLMAAKNFKRNRKRYRATVVSLFLSVTLFIAASSFCTYLTDIVGSASADDNRSDVTYYTVGDERPDPDEVLAMLTAVPGVTSGCYADVLSPSMRIPLENVSGGYWAVRAATPEAWAAEGALSLTGFVAFVDEDTFRALCAENGLRAEDYLTGEPRALLYNRDVTMTFDENGESHWADTEVLDAGALPAAIGITTMKELDGYELMEGDEDLYYYYPTEYAREIYRQQMEGEGNVEPDRSRALVLTREEAEVRTELTAAAAVKETLTLLPQSRMALIYPYGAREAVLSGSGYETDETFFALTAPEHTRVYETLRQQLSAEGEDTTRLQDSASSKESQRTLVLVVRVFSYGFIILISLIAMANVFNTISTSVMLRRREFAMLRSVGLGEKGFRKMMDYECLIYGFRGLLWGLPAAVALTYAIYRITGGVMDRSFYIPWHSVVIAVGSVFAVVFATMLYATGVIRRDNPIDALKRECL